MAAIDEAVDRVPDVKGALNDPGAIGHEPLKIQLLQLALLLYCAELLEQIATNTTPE
jgi:hypothetical protein